MRLYIYKRTQPDTLTDTHKVLAWFLTHIFRDAGEDQVITIDAHDFTYMYHGKSSIKLNVEQLNEGPLGKMFSFMLFGPRVGVKIRSDVYTLEKTKPGPHSKIGVKKYYVEDEQACRTAAYLHAALNFMPNWYMDPEKSIFEIQEYNGRFAPYSERTQLERFTFENLIGYSKRGRYKRKQEKE